ncbi:MAG: hypothetical protein ACYC5G_03870 [Candidatus Doudnabacteria bacterium]
MLNRRYNLSYKQAGTFIAFIVLAVFVFRFLNTQKNGSKPSNNNNFEIGLCRTCEVIKDKDLIIDEDRGEYLDSTLIKKLEILAGENKDWRITEAYPPTVQHISFCHQNGTCADIALQRNLLNADRLSNLCKDALAAGLTVVNEYGNLKYYSKNSFCPKPNIFETTTGGHLHVY